MSASDWRHLASCVEAGQQTYGEMLNLAVWVKSNAGQGSFYRSQHELIGVFRVGDAPHLNNIKLGRHGRSRSNVWRYAGVNSFRAGRMDELSGASYRQAGRVGGRRDEGLHTAPRHRARHLLRIRHHADGCGAGGSSRVLHWSSSLDTSISPSAVGKLSPGAMRFTSRPGRPSTSVRSMTSSHLKRQRVEEGAMARKSKIRKAWLRSTTPTRATISPPPRLPRRRNIESVQADLRKNIGGSPDKSGNPKGAKPKKRSLIPELKEEFERVFSQKLKVTQGDRQRLISRWVAGLEQLSIQFAKGDRHARRDVFYFAEKLGVDLLTSTKCVRRHALRRSSGDPRRLCGAANARKGHLCILPRTCPARAAR